jgi:hypothetical protein
LKINLYGLNHFVDHTISDKILVGDILVAKVIIYIKGLSWHFVHHAVMKSTKKQLFAPSVVWH